MRIALASDHGGFAMKEHVRDFLVDKGHLVIDQGTYTEDSCDYPEYAMKAVREVLIGQADRAVLICGTGIGVSIVANRFTGIRAALCHDSHTARLSRQHNDANTLCLGGRVLSQREADGILDMWLSEPFEGGRHERRINLFPEGASVPAMTP